VPKGKLAGHASQAEEYKKRMVISATSSKNSLALD
jgi:hypothetical protein